jgi:NAD(P)-dependent dehydrogenase (short-subunit alcohol dehydrogenase family)
MGDQPYPLWADRFSVICSPLAGTLNGLWFANNANQSPSAVASKALWNLWFGPTAKPILGRKAQMNKIAMITGAGSGVGRAVAKALDAQGWQLTLVGRKQDTLTQTAEALKSEPLIAPADVGDPSQVKTVFAKIADKFGRLDMLFNNAGIGAPAIAIEELTFEQWQAVVAVNLTGAFLCTQEAVRMMKSQTPRGGRIINNGSISADRPRPHSAPYTATKHAITGLTKSTILDGRSFDITAGQIDIGNAATEMTERMTQGVLQPDGQLAIEPRMDVDHVGQAVAYMAGLPLESNVPFMTIMATKMPLFGRG